MSEWHKSSYSTNNGCVELATSGDTVAVRDSKHADGPVLRFGRRELTVFLREISSGRPGPRARR